MQADFQRYMNDFRELRTKQILEAAGHHDEDEPDLTAILSANTFVTAEALLAAVALFGARRETNTPAD